MGLIMLRLTKPIFSFSIGFVLIFVFNARVNGNTVTTECIQPETYSFHQEYFIDKIDIPFDGIFFNIQHSHYESILKFVEPILRPNECMMLFASLVRTKEVLVSKVSFVKRRLQVDGNERIHVINTRRGPLCTLCNVIYGSKSEIVSSPLYINGAYVNHCTTLRKPEASVQLVSEQSLQAQ